MNQGKQAVVYGAALALSLLLGKGFAEVVSTAAIIVGRLVLVLKMDNTPNDGAFSVILCLFSQQYTKYSCVKQSSSDEKISRPWAYRLF